MVAVATYRCLAALGLAAAVSLSAAPIQAQDFNNQIKARQGLMRVQAANLGILAGMVRGRTEYDAEMAQVAADNLAAVGMIDQRFFWPEGSSNADVEGTRALPAIWEDTDAFQAEIAKFVEATSVIQAEAGKGMEALGPALRGVGQTCGSCHESYQQSE